MSAIVHHHGSQQRFVQVANGAARNHDLSLKARGLLVLLLSHTDGFQTSERRLADQCQEGRYAISTALQELEDAGYLHREQSRGEDGQMAGAVWNVTDQPSRAPWSDYSTTDNPSTKNTKGEKTKSPYSRGDDTSSPPRWQQILDKHQPNGNEASWDLLTTYRKAGRDIIADDQLDRGSLIALTADYVETLSGERLDSRARAMVAKTVSRNGLVALAGWDRAIGMTEDDTDRSRLAYATAVVNGMTEEMADG